MNVIYFTQSKSLDVFYELFLRTKERLKIQRAGFFVAHAVAYAEFCRSHPDFEQNYVVLKEWEIYRDALRHTPDLERVGRYEKEIGDPNLWGPVVTDRRLFMGRDATYHQDYKPRFAYEQQLAIIDIALQRIDAMFAELKPDLVCTIYTATFGDCLGHMFAKARGIRSLDLRLARLKNFVMLVDGIAEPPPHIAKLHDQFGAAIPDNVKAEAEWCLESIVSKSAMYEGVVPAASKAARGRGAASGATLAQRVRKVCGFLGKCRQRTKPPYCWDFQNTNLMRHTIFKNLINPWNVRFLKIVLRNRLIRSDELPGMSYVLYPLHTEPELVLSQFARPYLNQIEVIRNICLSVPVGAKVLVKEHPMMVGRRPFGYYRKILEITNARLADFDLPSEVVLAHARLVVIIRGAIGLEAVIKKIPVVSLGKSLFDILPPWMFRRCASLYELPAAIQEMMSRYRYDHEALLRYLAAVIQGSAPVNLVSDLLGKKGRFRSDPGKDGESFEKHPHLDILADYLIARASAHD